MIDKIEKKLGSQVEKLVKKSDLTMEDMNFLLLMHTFYTNIKMQEIQQESSEKFKSHISDMLKLYGEVD